MCRRTFLFKWMCRNPKKVENHCSRSQTLKKMFVLENAKTNFKYKFAIDLRIP